MLRLHYHHSHYYLVKLSSYCHWWWWWCNVIVSLNGCIHIFFSSRNVHKREKGFEFSGYAASQADGYSSSHSFVNNNSGHNVAREAHNNETSVQQLNHDFLWRCLEERNQLWYFMRVNATSKIPYLLRNNMYGHNIATGTVDVYLVANMNLPRSRYNQGRAYFHEGRARQGRWRPFKMKRTLCQVIVMNTLLDNMYLCAVKDDGTLVGSINGECYAWNPQFLTSSIQALVDASHYTRQACQTRTIACYTETSVIPYFLTPVMGSVEK